MKILFEIEYRGKTISENEIKNNKELVRHLYQNKLIELSDKELEEYGLKENTKNTKIDEKEPKETTKRVRRTRKK